MPYTIRKNAPGCPKGKPYAVVKTTDGEIMGCHESSSKAGAQIGAIEANEKAATAPEDGMELNTEQSAEQTSGTISLDPRHAEAVVDGRSDGEIQADKMKALRTKYMVPYDATSFAELDSYREAKRVADAQYSVLHDFQLLVENIMYGSEVEDKSAAIASLSAELPGRMKDAESGMDEKARVSEEDVDAITEKADGSPAGTGFTIQKQADGTYRWMAVYSNKYRDRDNPPEIIAEESHLALVKAVESGAVDYPELWIWHIPGTAIGKADYLDYVDGFAIAGGVIHPEHSEKARRLSQIPDLGVSHGMPPWSIKRRSDDGSIISRHITVEISPLPMDAAANTLTGFILEETMEKSLKDSQREFLRRLGYSDTAIENLGKSVEAKAAEADELALESKQEDEAEPEATDEAVAEVVDEDEAKSADEADEEVATDVADEEDKESEDKAQAPDLRDEIAVAMSELVKGLNDVITELGDTLKDTQGEVKALNDRLAAVEASDEDKIAAKAADTPTASLSSMVYNSIVGKDSARVDGRERYAKDGPHEAEAEEAPGPFFKQWINK
jgi:uncharacterized coiled-coil protein SlyX